jgi:hypothetical protein
MYRRFFSVLFLGLGGCFFFFYHLFPSVFVRTTELWGLELAYFFCWAVFEEWVWGKGDCRCRSWHRCVTTVKWQREGEVIKGM